MKNRPSIRDADHRSGPIPEPLCRAHLTKIADSVTFSRAEQLRRLLFWLADRSLAVQPATPSEKEIAAGVLCRKDFDPRADSLVRKEMSRLREKLSHYYLSEGARDGIRAGVEGYQLTFEHAGIRGVVDGASCWLVLPFRSGPEMVEHAEQLLEELLIKLDELAGPQLVAPTTARAYRGRAGDVRQFAAECHADFVIEGSLRCRDESFEAAVWLVDGQSGLACRSKRFTGGDESDVAARVVSWLKEDRASPF